MKINLVSDIKVDRNFALQKVKLFHENDEIIENDLESICSPGTQTYISVIFRKNRAKYEPYEGLPNTLIGGSGWDLSTVLPPEIDAIKPHVNYGFTQRGCNRTCGFCVVPQKEGRFHIVGNLRDLWDGTPKAEITLWDNNILLDKDHLRAICAEAKELGVYLDWNQGLDFRLVDEEVVSLLKTVKLVPKTKWRFALDDVASIPLFKEKLDLMRVYGLLDRAVDR